MISTVKIKKGQIEDFVSNATITYVDEKIVQTINNGDTTHTSSSDALFDALALKAPLASPVFTGNPTAPTPAIADYDTSLATTRYVKDNALSTSQAGTGVIEVTSLDLNNITATSVFYVGTTTNAPTAGDGFVMTIVAVTAGYQTFVRQGVQDYFWFRRKTGGVWQAWEQVASRSYVTTQLATKQDTLVSGTNIKTVGGVTLLGSGNVTEVQNNLTASTTLSPSVTAVNTALALKADLASPTFTGDPKAPTPAPGDNDTSIATTAFVTGAIATASVIKTTATASTDVIVTPDTFTAYRLNAGVTTVTLPTLTGNSGIILFFVNNSGVNVTVNSNAGGNDIWSGGATVNTESMTAGTIMRILHDGTTWSIL